MVITYKASWLVVIRAMPGCVSEHPREEEGDYRNE